MNGKETAAALRNRTMPQLPQQNDIEAGLRYSQSLLSVESEACMRALTIFLLLLAMVVMFLLIQLIHGVVDSKLGTSTATTKWTGPQFRMMAIKDEITPLMRTRRMELIVEAAENIVAVMEYSSAEKELFMKLVAQSINPLPQERIDELTQPCLDSRLCPVQMCNIRASLYILYQSEESLEVIIDRISSFTLPLQLAQ